MTIKQKLFIDSYLGIGNGTQAALNVYNTNKPNVAAQIAYENLRKPEIRSAINTYLRREHLPLESIAQFIRDSLDNGSQTEKLNAIRLCFKLYGIS